MTTYAVQDRATGEIVYAYTGASAVDWPEYPFALFNHIPQTPASPIPPPVRAVSKLEYLRRFEQDERIAIRNAAVQSPQLADYLAMLELADEINLDDPDTVGAVQMLEAAGLVAHGRAAEILA